MVVPDIAVFLHCSEVVGHCHCDFLRIHCAATLVDLQRLALAVQNHLQILRAAGHKRRHIQGVTGQPRVQRLLQLCQHLPVSPHDLHPRLAWLWGLEERANAVDQYSAHLQSIGNLYSKANTAIMVRIICRIVARWFSIIFRPVCGRWPVRSWSLNGCHCHKKSQRVRKSEVVAPLVESTQRQQHSTLKHPKNEQHSTLEAKSESTIPGCRQTVFTFGYLVSLSARPTVNSTFASLDLEQVDSAPKSLPARSWLGSAEVCLCASEERLMILPCCARVMRGSSRCVSRKWPKWLTAMVISTLISFTSRVFIIMPALFMSTSITQKQPLTSCANFYTDCRLERSSLNHLMVPLELGEDCWICWVA